MNGWWLDGGRAGLNAAQIHYPYHSEALWGSWGCLWMCLCHRTASWGRRYQRSFSVWHLRTADWIIISLLHRLHTPCFCSGLLLERQRLLYCLYLVSERWCLFSEAGRLCLFHSATIKLNLPLSVRGEFKNPSVCVTEQKWYQAKHNLTDSLEHALRKTISRW